MMFDWLFAPPHDRRLPPGGNYRGPTPFVIAIMTFSMMIVAAAGLALSNAAGLVAKGIDSRYSVQVPGGSRDLPAVLEAVRTAPGVLSAEAVPGSGDAQDARAVAWSRRRQRRPCRCRRLSRSTSPIPPNLAAIASRVEKAAPGTRFVAHDETLAPLLKSVRALQWLALALVALLAAATSAAVVLAARGALDTHRSTIEVMHGIGATDVQVTRLFQRKIALDALAGGLFGGAAAAIVLAVLAAGGSALAGDLTGAAPLGRKRPADPRYAAVC